ncbi:MAG: hypothetical protein AAF621_02770 [Pseudomonadota bacterium]
MRMKLLNKFISDKSANILATTALASVGIATVVVGSVDAANYLNINSSFQSAIDTAIMAAVPVSQTRDIDKVAREFFYANFPERYHNDIDIESINIIELTDVVGWEISVDATVETTFAKFIGIDKLKLNHKAQVQWDIAQRVEAVFTLDTSSSMCMDLTRDRKEDGTFKITYTPDYSCKKIQSMKSAMKYVIGNSFPVMTNTQAPIFYVGMVPFNHKVKLPKQDMIPEPLMMAERLSGDVDYYSTFEDAEPLAPVVSLRAIETEEDKGFLMSKLTSIVQTPLGLGWTRSNVAALTAALMLDPKYNNYFENEAVPAPFDANSESVDKTVVMMTDGANIGCCYAAYPEGNFDNQYLYLYKLDNFHLTGVDDAESTYSDWYDKYHLNSEGICKQMRDAGITIFTVVYDVNDRDPGGQAIKEAYRKCAHTEKHFFDARSDQDLKKAYQTIAQSFLRLRITY